MEFLEFEITRLQAERRHQKKLPYYLQAFHRVDGFIVYTAKIDHVSPGDSSPFRDLFQGFRYEFSLYPQDDKSTGCRFFVDPESFDETLGLGKNSKGGNYSSRWRTHLGSDLKDWSRFCGG